MRVGIFGGTFNPIHYGHLRLAECAVMELGLDKVYFLPTNIPPHKDSSQIIDIEHREKMVLLAIEGNHFFAFSDMESRTKSITYTADTILKFKEMTGGAELFFITGSDTLKTFHKYVRYKTILANAKLVVAPRPDSFDLGGIEKDVLDAAVIIKNFEQLDISSTRIRELVNGSSSIRYLVADDVREYIIANSLYRPENEQIKN